MNYNFYAAESDKIEVLEFLFNETSIQVFDLYSPFGQEISEYKNLESITKRFDLSEGGQFSANFQLWSPDHKGSPIFKKIKLNPETCNGYDFRYNTLGWGMIQLYFGGIKDGGLNYSHIGHFNEKGALSNETGDLKDGKVSDWDWKMINKTSRMLKYQIHNKMSVRHLNSCGVLTDANMLAINGIELLP